MIKDIDSLCAPIKEIALKAGALELDYYRAGADVMHKSDGSPVTLADQEAEALIVEELNSLTPDIPIVAEESVAAGHIPDITDGIFWLVDPLDGTKEFVKGSGEFTVNIALMIEFRPVLGVIYAPVTDELYSGYKNGAADLTIAGVRHEISVRTPPEEGLTVLTSRSHTNMAALDEYLDRHDVAGTVFRGSSLKICHIAAGKADLYPRLIPTCEWDIAAGHAIIDAAGGCLNLLDGSEMTYGKVAQRFINPHFVVKAAA